MIEAERKKTEETDGYVRDARGYFAKGNKGKPKGAGAVSWPGLVRNCQRKYGKGLAFQHPDLGEIEDIHEIAFVMLYSAVANGEPWAVESVINRKCGKPKQAIEVDGDSPASNFVVIVKSDAAGNDPGTTAAIDRGRANVQADG